jgi:hypothetical protein
VDDPPLCLGICAPARDGIKPSPSFVTLGRH